MSSTPSAPLFLYMPEGLYIWERLEHEKRREGEYLLTYIRVRVMCMWEWVGCIWGRGGGFNLIILHYRAKLT